MAKHNSSERGHWGSKLGFFFAAVGSAVGLGNIWKFPYIAGENGGGAFVLVYLLCIAAVGVPIFIAELYIGRKSQKDAVTSFIVTDRPGTPWQIAGWLGLASAFLILSFYSVVGGWVLDFATKAIFNEFGSSTDEQVKGMLGELFASPGRMIIWHLVFMVLTVGIVLGGIKNGIERWSSILMPALFAILLILVFWTMPTEGFSKAALFLFSPDFSKLTADAVLEAVGHSFFTLSLGMAAMITYGSYLSKDSDLLKFGVFVSLADTAVALCAGLVIFSIVFTYGLEPSAGPGLMFGTLPTLFNSMPGGYIIAILFFFLVAFAALTSAISLLEVVVTHFIDERNLDRKLVTIVAGSLIWLLGILCALSFNVMSDVTIGGLNFFDLFDGLTSKIFLPLGGMLISLFFGWVLGPKAVEECLQGRGGQIALHGLLWTTRVVAPAAIAWVFYNQIQTLF